MMTYKENTIKELVDHNALYHLVTDKLDIPEKEFSKTFHQLCTERNMSYEFIEKILKAYDTGYEFPYAELEQCSLTELVSYLQKSHNFYLKKKLPEMELTSISVFNKYHDSHTLISYLCLFFNDYKKRIVEHIKFEESQLFPYVINLLNTDSGNFDQNYIFNALNSFSAKQFLQNHTHLEDELQEVRQVILKYSEKNKSPLPFKIFLTQLHHFEIELTKHAIIEDEIFIPKVIELEAHLLKKVAKSTSHLNKLA
jgi:regulator of cell morphogenesis and NO signaling